MGELICVTVGFCSFLQRGFALSHLGVTGCDRGDAFDKDGRWWYNDCCG